MVNHHWQRGQHWPDVHPPHQWHRHMYQPSLCNVRTGSAASRPSDSRLLLLLPWLGWDERMQGVRRSAWTSQQASSCFIATTAGIFMRYSVGSRPAKSRHRMVWGRVQTTPNSLDSAMQCLAVCQCAIKWQCLHNVRDKDVHNSWFTDSNAKHNLEWWTRSNNCRCNKTRLKTGNQMKSMREAKFKMPMTKSPDPWT